MAYSTEIAILLVFTAAIACSIFLLHRYYERRFAVCEIACIEQYRRRLEIEQARLTSQERRRLMRELHDGLGSQLIQAMLIAQKEDVPQAFVIALLQQCVDDMRLILEGQSDDDRNFLAPLEEFRYRMAARFKAIGIALHWRQHDLPETVELDANVRLQILRILQEALTNVFKHAQASEVQVDVRLLAGSLQIRIRDNGIGMPQSEATARGGQGMANVQRRASEIGGAVTVTSGEWGVEVLLALPLIDDSQTAPEVTQK